MGRKRNKMGKVKEDRIPRIMCIFMLISHRPSIGKLLKGNLLLQHNENIVIPLPVFLYIIDYFPSNTLSSKKKAFLSIPRSTKTHSPMDTNRETRLWELRAWVTYSGCQKSTKNNNPSNNRITTRIINLEIFWGLQQHVHRLT